MTAGVLLAGGAIASTRVSSATASAGPEWMPLKGRFPNGIGCTWANGCNSPTPGYHGYNNPAIDFMVPRFTPLYAAGPGTVEVAYRDCPEGSNCGPNGSGLGNAVAIRHDNGRYSWYAHLSAVYPAEGSRVETGELIGTTGSTGVSTGPHLHYEERTTLWSTPTLPGSMFAYHGRKKVKYPEELGKTSWQALPCGVQRGEPGCKARHTIRNDGYSIEPEVPTGAAPIDIEIAIDTSGSMQPSIDQARVDARNLIDGVRKRYPGVRFAIAQFRDHSDSLEYRVEQTFTADIDLARLAVARLTAAGGHDAPEAYNLVFNRSLDPGLGWRSGSHRLLVVIGDAEPHGAGIAGFSGCRDTSSDPRGMSAATELAKLRKARVTLLMVFQSSTKSTASLECYRSLAAAAAPGSGAFGGGSDLAGGINRLIDKALITYVAIGDSYSSGEGNPPFTGGECHRSEAAWPNILATRAHRLSFLGNRACSGAEKPALDNPYKGKPPMIDQVAALKPDLVTLTITGNDVGFSSILGNCMLLDCVQNGRLRHAFNAAQAQRTHLPGYLSKLKKAAPQAKIVLVGYPQIFPRTQAEAVNCGWLEPEERQALNSLGEDLNEFERQAAATAGITFVSVANVLAGHELCTQDSWMFKIVVTCVRDSKCGHPLKPGQEAIANRVQKALGL